MLLPAIVWLLGINMCHFWHILMSEGLPHLLTVSIETTLALDLYQPYYVPVFTLHVDASFTGEYCIQSGGQQLLAPAVAHSRDCGYVPETGSACSREVSAGTCFESPGSLVDEVRMGTSGASPSSYCVRPSEYILSLLCWKVMTRRIGVLILGLEPLLPHPPSRVVSQIKMSIMRYFLYRHDYQAYVSGTGLRAFYPNHCAAHCKHDLENLYLTQIGGAVIPTADRKTRAYRWTMAELSQYTVFGSFDIDRLYRYHKCIPYTSSPFTDDGILVDIPFSALLDKLQKPDLVPLIKMHGLTGKVKTRQG